MRLACVLGLAAITLCGCGNDGGATVDMTAPAPDLAVTAPRDMTARLSCKATDACITGTCTQANLNTCIPACIAQLDPAAQTYFDALEQCAGPACTTPDGGAGPCLDPGSTACAACVAQNCAAENAACQAH